MHQNQKKVKFGSQVMEVFSQVQKLISPHQTHIFELVKYFNEDPEAFHYAFEQAFLKIFKSFHRGQKKIPSKFQTLAEQFFENILPLQKPISEVDGNGPEITLLNKFLELCSEGIFSNILNIRVMCSRLIFLLIKLIPPKKLQFYVHPKVIDSIFAATLHLVRTKIPTYRQLGIKISSLILQLENLGDGLEKELFKIMSIEDNQQIRKMVITNITINKSNLDQILLRLRDKNPQIRAIVVKKLQGEHFNLYNMSISQIYKLLYDGYGSKELIVKRECVRYFAMFFTEKLEGIDIQNRQKEFIFLFRPDILLLNPHLYSLFNDLIVELLEEVQSKMKDYIKALCFDLKNVVLHEELVWLKNAANSQSREVSKVYDEFGPTGIQLSRLLLELAKKNSTFALYQLLQLFASLKMPEQIGRNKMFDALKTFLSELSYHEVEPSYQNFESSDICYVLEEKQVERKKLLLNYYDTPIISNSFDLILEVGQAMRNLRPEHYEIEMKQIMAEWHSPEENTRRKEKELLEANIRQLPENNEQILKTLKQKLEKVIAQLEYEGQKSRKVLLSISRLRHSCNLESYLVIIREELSKEDKSNGLILLGLYCLENMEKVETFWKTYWDYLSATCTDHISTNHQLISIKVVTDFIVKFNSLSQPQFAPEEMEDFNSDMFMQCMVKLILSKDGEVRILAIESLCRMIYHERIDESNLYSYFLYLLLLWLETSNEEVSSRAVHTVSIFMRSFLEKGNSFVIKLAEVFCIFFKVLLKFQDEGKGINKSIIKYNLTPQEFIKKTIAMVLTVLRYQKENRPPIWKYAETEIGPQQFVVIFLLKEEHLTPLVGKALNICDFYEYCNLETLIIVKKLMENVNETKRFKGVEQIFKKFELELETHISLKNSETFNDHIVESLEKENNEKVKMLMDEARRIHKNLEEQNLFIQIDSESEESEDGMSEEAEVKSDHDEVKDAGSRKKEPPIIELDSDSGQNLLSSVSGSHSHGMRLRRRK